MLPTLRRTAILGVGSAVPERVMTNDDLSKLVDTNDAWIIERTGIRQRHIAEPGEALSDYCLKAAQKALAMAGITPDQLDMIITGTATADYQFPAVSTIVQHKLGTSGQMAMDTTAACSGFLYSLSVADHFIRCSTYDYALVIGAELLSRIVDWEDRSTCVLFGDGAGAVVVGPSEDEERGILSWSLSADGATWPSLYMPGGGCINPASEESVKDRLHFIKMEGSDVFKTAVRTLQERAEVALENAGLKPEDVDLFVPHQANLRIIKAVGKRLGIAEENVFVNVDRYGNTSAASIPIALAEALGEGRIKKGDLLLLDSFGAGATAAATCIRW